MTITDKYDHKLEPLIRSLPEKPGIYQYLDSEGNIIYIGKAKNLKKRVSSYFNKDTSMSGKIRVLVKKIDDIKLMVVDSELDALLLENSLIKKYQPRYNVQWKDDKSFPWIRITRERFPRVFHTRNIVRDGSEYFGPYASVKIMRSLLDLIRQLYPLRNCKLNLAEENIKKNKFKVCLEYHLGNCLGPCEGLQREEAYNGTISSIREIIKGNLQTVYSGLKEEMSCYVSRLEFEKAQLIKDKIELLEKYQSRSTVVNPRIADVDVFTVITDSRSGYVNFLKIVNGAIVQTHTMELRKKLDETPQELLLLAMVELRQRYGSYAHEIIIPFSLDLELADSVITVPLRGDKKKLLDLSERNARYYRAEKEKQRDLVDPERHSKRILRQMKIDLRLTEEPVHIECFDNSNLQGQYPVASVVVFKKAKPFKKEYRHFNIKTVEGPDDYASMEEIIYRRYKRLLDEQKPLPQLIVIDGGKGQLHAAMNSLEKLGLRGKSTLIGIAKKLEEIYYPGDTLPLYLDKKSETLKVLQHIRDEAHRFGITFHRKKREKATIRTELTEIGGIGPATAELLLKHYGSVAKIREIQIEDLAAVIGVSKAGKVVSYFEKKTRQ